MGQQFPPALSQEDLDTYFPLDRAPIQANTYELGLTLGGTVSAGTYTAGVLDYLIEALDLWTRAKEDGGDVPKHDVVLSTIAGASGGAVNAAILTRVAGWEFPHGPVAGNPFYDLWVNGVDLAKLLDPHEPNVKGFAAIFNTTAFATLANAVITQTGKQLGGSPTSPRHRSYLADPLRTSMMVANVTGVPYRIGFHGESGLGHELVAHADWMRFALTVPGGVKNPPATRPDEVALSSRSQTSWDILAASALATSAFPAAFRSRPLKRELSVLGYRVVVVPGDKPGTAEHAQLLPRWEGMTEDASSPGYFRTVNVDGGTFNNEPLDHTRTALSGYAARNPRDGLVANRGVLLVDPFSDPEAISLYDPPGFFDLIGPLLGSLISQARFKPEDIALASDFNTYSRFLVAPIGPGPGAANTSGSSVIASGGLGGFLGFVDRRFLDHDFKLGRRNAYEFLRNEFVLPRNNPIFAGKWTTTQIEHHLVKDTNPSTKATEEFLPLIPLVDALRDNPPQLAPWPKLSAAPDKLGKQTEARLDALYAAIKKDAGLTGWKAWLATAVGGLAWKSFLRAALRDAFVNKVIGGLKKQKLL